MHCQSFRRLGKRIFSSITAPSLASRSREPDEGGGQNSVAIAAKITIQKSPKAPEKDLISMVAPFLNAHHCAPHYRGLQRLSLVGLIVLLGLVHTERPSQAQFLGQPTFANSIPQAKRVLKRGDRGNDVTRLQQQLQQVGVFTGPITGYFGPKTESAVRQFQRSQGLPVDGIAGTRTQTVLNTAAGSSDQPPFTPFRRGAQGELVRQMQFRLLLLGYLNGSVTRNFDNTTQQALIQFQRSRGLTPDGVVGQRTWSSLQKAISSGQIQAMQERLRTAGFYNGSINGQLNISTQRAVEAAQRVYGVSAGDILRGSY